jgi:hypothetical protein
VQTTPHPDRPAWLLTLLGPDGLARMGRDLDAEENTLLEAALIAHDGDWVAAFGATPDHPHADHLRALMARS